MKASRSILAVVAVAVLGTSFVEEAFAWGPGRAIGGIGLARFSSVGRFDALYDDQSQSFLLAYELEIEWHVRLLVEVDNTATVSFDRDGFYTWNDVSRAVPVVGESAKVSWSSIGLRLFPAAIRRLEPYVDFKLS